MLIETLLNFSMGLLYGCYRRSSAGLHCVLTNQTLRLVEEGRDAATFDYADDEMRERVAVAFRYWDRSLGRNRLLDVLWPTESEIRSSYGRWRRLTFFLLDALLAFYAEEEDFERRVGTVTIAGGWFEGRWQDKGRFEASSMISHPDVLVGEVHPFDLVALDTPPPSWRFEFGLDGPQEGKIRITGLHGDGELPLADTTMPLCEQLADVPRFVSSDGEILFFHRVIPYLGPEYAPGLETGLCTRDYAFTFSDSMPRCEACQYGSVRTSALSWPWFGSRACACETCPRPFRYFTRFSGSVCYSQVWAPTPPCGPSHVTRCRLWPMSKTSSKSALTHASIIFR